MKQDSWGNKTQAVAFSQDGSFIEQLQQAALGIASMQLETVVGNLGSAQKEYRNQTSPDLLILDLSLEPDPLDALRALADVCSPNTKVLTLGSNNELDFYQRIIKLGVSDYLPLPTNEATLVERLQSIISGHSQYNHTPVRGRKGRQLLISAATSGIGCSLICAQLAHILSDNIGMHLAVIDTDIQAGALDLYMGVKSQSGLQALLEQPDRIDELLLERASVKVANRLRLFKTQSAQFHANSQLKQSQIQQFSQLLSPHYSAILWELPRFLQAQEVANELYLQSDDILIVLECSVVGLRDTLRIKQYLEEQNCLAKVHWVINHHRAKRYSKVSKQDLIHHAQLQDSRVLELPFDAKAATSTDLGEPLRSGNLYSALKNLAHTWIGHYQAPQMQTAYAGQRKSAKKWRGIF